MTTPAYSTHAALAFAAKQSTCYTDPWGYRGHLFMGEAVERCQCGAVTRDEHRRAGARLWNGGVFRSAIVQWLRDVVGVTVWIPGREINRDPVLRRVVLDTEADETGVAWCATRERALACRAGLVIAPVDTTEADTVADLIETVIVPAEDPKRLFAEVAHRFLPALPDRWPGADAIIGSRTPLAPGVVIGPDVVLGNDVIIGPNTVLANCTIGHGCRIGANCTIGLGGFGYVRGRDDEWLRFPQRGRVVIGDQVDIGSNTCIDRGALADTVIEPGAKIDNLVHIAHNCRIGPRALIIAGATLCGGTVVGADAHVAPNAVIREQRHVGERSVVGLGAVVVRDVEPDTIVKGNPAR